MAKSVTVAYILWFFLGWLGVHQFYLRRDKHAFFTWATLGGVFGISWLRDLIHIPRYTAAANESPEYMEELTAKMQRHERPQALGLCRWLASVALGIVFGGLVYMTFWREGLHPKYVNMIAIASHIASAFGVYLPANEGHMKVPFKWCLLGSLVVAPFTITYGTDVFHYGPMLASAVAGYKLEWRRQPQTDGLCSRLLFLLLLGSLYLTLCGTAIYYNASVTTKEGETVPLRVAMQNFFKSPAWQETKETIHHIYVYVRHNGWRRIWQEIVDAIDPQGEANAYKTLGVDSSVTPAELKAAYKKLAVQYHPDKAKDPQAKREYEEKFMAIQEAYDTVSKLRRDRNKVNKKNAD